MFITIIIIVRIKSSRSLYVKFHMYMGSNWFLGQVKLDPGQIKPDRGQIKPDPGRLNDRLRCPENVPLIIKSPELKKYRNAENRTTKINNTTD